MICFIYLSHIDFIFNNLLSNLILVNIILGFNLNSFIMLYDLYYINVVSLNYNVYYCFNQYKIDYCITFINVYISHINMIYHWSYDSYGHVWMV